MGPLPTSLGTCRAGPGKTSGSTVGCVSTSSQSPSLSLEGQGDFFSGQCLAPHLLPQTRGRSPNLSTLPSLLSQGQLKSQSCGGDVDVSPRSMSQQVIHTSSSSRSSEGVWTQQHCLGAPCGQRLPRLKEVEPEKGSLHRFLGETPCLSSQTPRLKGESEPSSTRALALRTRRVQTTAPWMRRRVQIRV